MKLKETDKGFETFMKRGRKSQIYVENTLA